MRIALVLFLIAACGKSDKGASGEPPAPIEGQAPPPGNTTGSGPPSQPAQETQVGSADNSIIAQQARVALGEPDAAVPELPADLGSGSGKGPPGKITIASKTSFDRTDLTADAVAEKIMKDHFAALSACYRTRLATDASVKGKATLAWSVKPDGTIAKVKATVPDAALQTCFGKAMTAWTFPVPKSADGTATEAGFQIALALAPE